MTMHKVSLHTFKGVLLAISMVLFFCSEAHSQAKKIKIIQADNTFSHDSLPEVTVSLGNVKLAHEGVIMSCDKAFIFHNKKIIKATGNVLLNQGDSIFQNSKNVEYYANEKLAISWGNVKLRDPKITLTTDTLNFDRIKQKVYYKDGGKLKDSTSTLTSIVGTYNLRNRVFNATQKVFIVNENGTVTTDDLVYDTESGEAQLMGPSKIKEKKDSILTTKGFYNLKTKISHFLNRSKIYYNDRIIVGDSLYYNQNLQLATGTGKVKVIDTINKGVLRAGYAEYHKGKDSLFLNQKPVFIVDFEKDSTYITGKQVIIKGRKNKRIIKVYPDVKIFKSDLQGVSDSLVSVEEKGTIRMYKRPVLWAKGNQITADTITLKTTAKMKNLDSLLIRSNGFMVQKDSLGYNQMRGKNMFGKFVENKMYSLDVVGNSEVIFFVKNEAKKIVGVTKMNSSRNIMMTFDEGKINTIDFNHKPEGKTYPPSVFEALNPNERRLKGFIWREEERPLDKNFSVNASKNP